MLSEAEWPRRVNEHHSVGLVAMKPGACAAPSIAGLRSMGLLGALPADTLRVIAEQCVWRRYSAGARIVSREAREYDVYWIITGSVRVTAFSRTGRQVTYRDLHAGDWFGDLAAIDHCPRSADVIALDESTLASLRSEQFVELIFSHRPVADAMLRHLAHRVRDLTDRVFELSTASVPCRIDAEILRLVRIVGATQNRCRIDPAPRHSDIATRVSTNREQVTRELSRLVKQGVLSRDARTLIVQDVARLERLVAGFQGTVPD